MIRRMTAAGRSGFSLVEMLIVVTVGGILMTFTVMNASTPRNSYSVGSAERVFGGLHARARSLAVETGEIARLHVDMAGDSVWISSGGDRVDSVDFRDRFNVDIRGESSTLVICMNPRGFAERNCNSFASAQRISFVRGGHVRSIQILPLGQVIYP